MKVIYAADLSFASEAFKGVFEAIKSSTTNMDTEIDNFTNDSSIKEKFKGEGWNSVRTYMGAYKKCFSSLEKVCDTLSNNIVSANNSVIKAMKSHTSVDIDSADELDKRIESIGLKIQYLEANKYIRKKDVDEKGKTKFLNTGQVDSNIQELINQYSDDLRDLRKLLRVVKATREAYESAKALMDGEVTDFLSSFITKANAFSGK